jgi:aspartyl-tRNA(Asn)/glutamyl-tRNA(Gln) amidotransferase subunit C
MVPQNIDIKYVAKLARIKLTDDEVSKLSPQLNDIILYIRKLDTLDTDKVESTSHVLPVNNVFRPDKVGKSLSREEVLGNAPDSSNGCFRVPRIVEEG